MKSNYNLLGSVLGVFVTSIASAAFIPNLSEATGASTSMHSQARGYASYLDESILPTSGAPIIITGIQFRLSQNPAFNGVPSGDTHWPASNLNFSDFTVQIGRANSAWSSAGEFLSKPSTFANVFDGNQTVTRSGALTISAGSFANDGTPTLAASWGPTIEFSTPYVYTPGQEIAYTLFHSGYGSGPSEAFFAAADYGKNIGDAVSFDGVSNNATVPSNFTSPYVVQFITAPVPEPASMAALGLGVAAMLRRRRK